ncbi:sulfatase [Carboxylicivirga sp. A043]|uniref:sulfatase family protein n=1 Tax=Carboxylicivirga litoralis TaxID=2816963 RepID=UPI0021CB18EA|nr:sulfatase [Carboxylicivirga sp. A043]MCU4155748.1 sulfatase [Carboxylicivirga sp. A043]
MKFFSRWLVISSLLVIAVNYTSCTKSTQPNVIVIFTDDQGYNDLSCYGATDFETPHLDKLAANGIRFTNFHVSTAVCSASRSALLTGCYNERVSVRGAYMPWDTLIGLNPDEVTIAEILKDNGYSTGMVGKWHLGRSKAFLPLQQGFDEYYGIPYSNDMWPVDYDGISVHEKDSVSKPWKLKYPPLPILEGDEIVAVIHTLEEQAQITTLYANKAVDFIKRHQSKPFFLYLAHSMPHVPIAASDKFRGKSEQGLYGDVMMEIDWSVGQVMQALRDANIEDNTLVIFTSDNGPWLCFGNHAGSAYPLREGKGSMWEGGHRVPCIMYWPNQIKGGQETDKLASTIDLLPTIANVTGANLPGNKLDGVDITPLLKGEDVTPRNEFWCYYGGELHAVKKGDWKLYFPHEYRSYRQHPVGNDGYPGWTKQMPCGLELYNLKSDIGETTNVIDQYPDVVEELQAVAKQARYELGDRLQKLEGHEVRPLGRIEPETLTTK